ncbi:MAG TPA: TonB-dependent receptor [Nannocystaceae bacterium]|nr:TonB-dependent receptor [Nannocystaceae bacterium]
MWSTALCVLIAETAIVSTAEAGPGDSVLVGVVRDARDGHGIEGAVVIVRGEKLQGERTMTTDAHGHCRIADLPPGVYEVTVLHRSFGAGGRRTGIKLRAGITARVDLWLVGTNREVIEVDVLTSTVDVGSSATGLSVDREMARRVPIATPTGKGGANRSFEAIAEATPGARSDTYGTSVAGASSPENRYAIDGLAVGDVATGLVGTPLSLEFLEEVRIEAGGYMPEHGRSTGSIIHAVTRRGSNDFHGGVWAFYTPGSLEGRREIARVEGDTLVTERNLKWIGDVGFDVGGRLVRDTLWFYGGVGLSRSVYNLTSSWNRVALGPDGYAHIDPDTGFTITERIAGTTTAARAQSTAVQALARLTYAPAKNHTLDLLGVHTPQLSGGGGTYGFDARLGTPEVVNNINGEYTALARKRRDAGSDVLLKWSTRARDDAWSFDTLLGWHHQHNSALPVDGTRVGSTAGLAGTPQVRYRKTNNLADDSNDDGIVDAPLLPSDQGYREVHALTDFIPLPAGAPAGACDPTPFTVYNPSTMLAEHRSVVCPVTGRWHRGGPGLIYDRFIDRAQARHIVTGIVRGAGHHVIKFGVDLELLRYSNHRGYSGDRLYLENTAGTRFSDFRQYGFLSGPDQPHVLHSLDGAVHSTTIGGFLQDSWSIMDRVTLNVGVRYDTQLLFASDRTLFMALPNQISPRLGLVWDPTDAGKAKVFANYARFYQSIPLTIASRAGSGEPQITSIHDASVCDPTDRNQRDICDSDNGIVTLRGPSDPDQRWWFPGGDTPSGRVPVDPGLKPQSSDEIVAGGEYELLADIRIGLQYTHRWLNRVIEDMSRDEDATSYFVGNPGYGIAADFPRAKRTYDAGTLFLDRRLARHWLLAGSYTLSWLRGNVSGLFRPEDGQLEPNLNSDFDLRSLLTNREGDLPGDTRHSVKVFVAGEIVLGNRHALRLGGALRARSGGPTNVLGRSPILGDSQVYLLPRGVGDRLPWSFSVDPTLAYTRSFTTDLTLTISLDIFNVVNLQRVIAVDQRYTFDFVAPVVGGTKDDLPALRNVDDHPAAVNPNFGKPTAYQSPRQFRFGLRLTF